MSEENGFPKSSPVNINFPLGLTENSGSSGMSVFPSNPGFPATTSGTKCLSSDPNSFDVTQSDCFPSNTDSQFKAFNPSSLNGPTPIFGLPASPCTLPIIDCFLSRHPLRPNRYK